MEEDISDLDGSEKMITIQEEQSAMKAELTLERAKKHGDEPAPTSNKHSTPGAN